MPTEFKASRDASKDCFVALIIAFTLAIQATRINEIITAYSTDVGPSSDFRNRKVDCMVSTKVFALLQERATEICFSGRYSQFESSVFLGNLV